MIEEFLWLSHVFGAANMKAVKLLQRFGGVSAAIEYCLQPDPPFLSPAEKKRVAENSRVKIQDLLGYCEERGYKIVTLSDPLYPAMLRNIYNPPLLLYAEGDVSVLDSPLSLSVVGTRGASAVSLKAAFTLSQRLAALGIHIVSGMAIGADKASHDGAVSAGGITIGVLACGIDVDYPKGALNFRKLITEKGGCVITELPPGTRVMPEYFSARNRIISGMSKGLLIIEAGLNSGCHLTASHAVSQNRELFCLPPPDIFDKRYDGVKAYLRDGATAVYDESDIALALAEGLEAQPRLSDRKTGSESEPAVKPQSIPPGIANETNSAAADDPVLLYLSKGPQTFDALIDLTGLSELALQDRLFSLQLDELVCENGKGAWTIGGAA